MRKIRNPIAFAAFGLFLLGCPPVQAAQQLKPEKDLTRIGSRNLTKGDLDLYSFPEEFEIGKQMAQRIEDLVTPLDDPPTHAYMQSLADRIVRNSDAKIPVRIQVIYSNRVDAFALPGGFLFVTTGLILRTRSEAELAGVIAHEVAHVADRDATRQMTQAELLRWMSLPLLYFGGPAGFAIRGSIALAGPLGASAFSRRAERRADFLGLQYLYKSGYDPEAYVDFFERMRKLEKQPHGMIARAFSSHPLTRRRVKAAEREIEKDLPPRPEYAETTSAYQNMRNRLEQMMRDQMTDIPYAAPKAPVLKSGSGAKRPASGSFR